MTKRIDVWAKVSVESGGEEPIKGGGGYRLSFRVKPKLGRPPGPTSDGRRAIRYVETSTSKSARALAEEAGVSRRTINRIRAKAKEHKT
jgi:hypothetical protein